VIALPLATETRAFYEAVVAHQGNVSASMIAGKWALKPGAGSRPNAPAQEATTKRPKHTKGGIGFRVVRVFRGLPYPASR